METNELGNLKSNELFDELKGKCKSIVKRAFYSWLVVCVIAIPLFFTELRLDSPKKIFLFLFLIVIVCLGVWFTLFNFRFLKKFDNLDTPDRLLSWFEKKHRYNMIIWLVSCLGLIVTYFAAYGLNFEAYLGAAIIIVIIAIIFYKGGPLWYLQEQHILEQLRELVDKN